MVAQLRPEAEGKEGKAHGMTVVNFQVNGGVGPNLFGQYGAFRRPHQLHRPDNPKTT
jgi:hypothetical protein